MPSKNSLKQFVENSYYHLYNRGVEKRKIFLDDQDYTVFLSYFKTYLLPKDTNHLQKIILDSNSDYFEKFKASRLLRMNNFNDLIFLYSFCLMPNHFHLLLKQRESDGIDRFMNSIGTRYTMYFNKKYKRVGPLFQGVYKAVLVETNEQLLYLTKYIHRNPSLQGTSLLDYQYSSYPAYLNLMKVDWLQTKDILENFSVSGYNSYKSFVEDRPLDENEYQLLTNLTIDEDDI